MSTLKATTLSNLAGSKTVPTDTVVDGSAKAWVNFNGTGTVAIRRAFNVSSITDVGVGTYTVNISSAMSDANYATTTGFSRNGTSDFVHLGAATASSLGLEFWSGGAKSDPSQLDVAIFS